MVSFIFLIIKNNNKFQLLLIFSIENRILEPFRSNNIQLAETMLDGGLDPNFQDSDGNSLLHAASSKGHTKAMETLIKRKADPHLQVKIFSFPSSFFFFFLFFLILILIFLECYWKNSFAFGCNEWFDLFTFCFLYFFFFFLRSINRPICCLSIIS